MRKAHEQEVEKERKKFLDLLAKTHSNADLESLQKQHEYATCLLTEFSLTYTSLSVFCSESIK